MKILNIALMMVFCTMMASCQNVVLNEKEKKEEAIDYASFESMLQEERHGVTRLADALASGKISPEDYLDWTFTYQTSQEDGKEDIEVLEEFIFSKAEADEKYLKGIGAFYAQWPPEALESFKDHRHAGARKIWGAVQKGKKGS